MISYFPESTASEFHSLLCSTPIPFSFKFMSPSPFPPKQKTSSHFLSWTFENIRTNWKANGIRDDSKTNAGTIPTSRQKIPNTSERTRKWKQFETRFSLNVFDFPSIWIINFLFFFLVMEKKGRWNSNRRQCLG